MRDVRQRCLYCETYPRKKKDEPETRACRCGFIEEPSDPKERAEFYAEMRALVERGRAK